MWESYEHYITGHKASEQPVCKCAMCEEPIYYGDDVWIDGGEVFHEDCIREQSIEWLMRRWNTDFERLEKHYD